MTEEWLWFFKRWCGLGDDGWQVEEAWDKKVDVWKSGRQRGLRWWIKDAVESWRQASQRHSAPDRLLQYITLNGETLRMCMCVFCIWVDLGMLCWSLITPQHNRKSHAFPHSHSSGGTQCVSPFIWIYQCACVSICLPLSLSACLSVNLLLYSLIPLQYQRPWFKADQ